MAEALKTFREGEDILASETNENNQFLLSKLSDNAAQVQQYVEGEVATIKSNVSSVQATLQNNIDELGNTISTKFGNMFNAISPDYSKGISITSGYKAASYGQVYVEFKNGGGAAYADGKRVAYNQGDVNYHQPTGHSFIVGEGTTITANNYAALVFYPCKGFAEGE